MSFICKGISDECFHDIIKDSKDLETKAAITCLPALEVFETKLSGPHDAMASQLKYHQKFSNKIIVIRIPEVLYA